MIYVNVGSIRDPLKQDLALDFYRKQNKYMSILTKTHIKHDQILHIRNNWLGPIFLSPGSGHTKAFIDPKGRFVSFKVTLSNNRVLCFVPLKDITPESSWLKGVSLKDYEIIWEINVREIKTKLYLETLILLWIKWTGMVEMKHVVPKAQDLYSYKIC